MLFMDLNSSSNSFMQINLSVILYHLDDHVELFLLYVVINFIIVMDLMRINLHLDEEDHEVFFETYDFM